MCTEVGADSHEFRFYESLFEVEPKPAVPADADSSAVPPATAEEVANATIERAITLLAEAKDDPWINKTPTFNMVKRRDPTFDRKELKFATFSAMLKSLEGVLLGVRKGELDPQFRIKRLGAEGSA